MTIYYLFMFSVTFCAAVYFIGEANKDDNSFSDKMFSLLFAVFCMIACAAIGFEALGVKIVW